MINISSIRSEKVIMSLYDYFVLGFTRNEICSKNGINPGYLSIKIREFHEFYKKILSFFTINK
ncbi:TPA: PapB/FocB family fimbrial expression transcriptional regulator [Salmonella enterica subsp. enterica serovar Enteritidis]